MAKSFEKILISLCILAHIIFASVRLSSSQNTSFAGHAAGQDSMNTSSTSVSGGPDAETLVAGEAEPPENPDMIKQPNTTPNSADTVSEATTGRADNAQSATIPMSMVVLNVENTETTPILISEETHVGGVVIPAPVLVAAPDTGQLQSSLSPLIPQQVSPTLPPPDINLNSFEPSYPPSPFERMEDIYPDFESQVVALHIELCSTKCEFPYEGYSGLKARGCSVCFCDALCHVYRDCCPDLQLTGPNVIFTGSHTVSSPSEQTISPPEHDIDTCELSHLKPLESEDDYDNYFSMVNYCPQNSTPNPHNPTTLPTHVTLGDLSPSEQTTETLEDRCENTRNSSDWQYLRPLSSGGGVVYRNQFCAECHGERKDNLTAWTTSVSCDASLLQAVSSATEAYDLAVNTQYCDVRFHSDRYDVLRRCTSLSQSPLISTCNTTGLWTHYDDKVARACASFTSPVKRKYKNAFCYLCNTYYPFEVAQWELRQGYNGNNIGRTSFYALLDFDSDDDNPDEMMFSSIGGSNTSASVEEECEEGMMLDPLQCQCRPVQCGAALRVEGDNCTEVFAFSNYFGFAVCSRFHIVSDRPMVDTTLFEALMDNVAAMSGDLTVKHTIGYPRLDCEDDTRLTVDVQIEIYSQMATHRKQMADRILEWLQGFDGMFTEFNVNGTVTAPAANCVDLSGWIESLSSITSNCSTRDSTLSLGVRENHGMQPFGLDLREITFSPLHNSTFCPRVNLSEDEFANFSHKLLQLGMSDRDLVYDISVQDSERFYLLCARDYMIEGSCKTAELSETGDRFEDTWTAVGVTSLVCTCVSLVCLLAVVVSYVLLPSLRAGTGKSTLAMTCLLFVAQALHELGIEQYDIYQLCLVLAVLVHFFWLCAVFMMTSCTLQLYVSIVHPLKARMAFASKKVLKISLLSSSGLTAAIIGATMLANHLLYDDLGYPAQYLCFIQRPLSRQLAFGLPLGLAVLANIVIFILTITYIRRRPSMSSTSHDNVSIVACFRLSVITGACWLSLFLLAVPGTRPWLEYVFVVLLGLQGLLLATTLLLNARVYNMWRDFFKRRKPITSDNHTQTRYTQGRTESEKKDAEFSTIVDVDSNDSNSSPRPFRLCSATKAGLDIEANSSKMDTTGL